METISIDNDISVFYITASSFPGGVLAAHQQLHAMVPFSQQRRYFGISRPEHGHIVYMAATEEMERGEAQRYGCGTLILRAGSYLAKTIHNYMQHIPAIGDTFQLLLSQPGIDPQDYCLELYLNDKDLRYMVRLAV